MGPWRVRRTVLAALLLLPLLVSTAHAGHGCPLERDCTACRCALSSVAEVAEPTAPPTWEPLVEELEPASAPRLGPGALPDHSTRGPPLA